MLDMLSTKLKKTSVQTLVPPIYYSLSLALILCMPALAHGQKPTAPVATNASATKGFSRISGTLPPTSPKMSLNAEAETITKVLKKIANQGKWNLALSLPADVAERKVTLVLKDKPALTALQAVLDLGELEAKFEDQLLIVKATSPAISAQPVVDRHSAKVDIHIDDKDENVDEWEDNPDDGHNIVRFSEDILIDKNKTVHDVIAIGGSIRIKGHVTGDAVAIGGSVILEPGAKVDHDAVTLAGDIVVPNGATVGHDRVSVGGSLGNALKGIIERLAPHGKGTHRGWSWSYTLPPFVGTLFKAIILLVFGLLFLAFIPQRIHHIRGFLSQRPGISILGGFGLLIGIIPLCILLILTIIGIPLVPIVLFLFLFLLMMSLVVFALWLGYRLPFLSNRKSPFLALLLGVLLLTIVDLIPYVGSTIILIVTFITAGAILLSRFGRTPSSGDPSQPFSSDT